MKNNKKILIILTVVFAVAFGYICFRMIKHEKVQDQMIASLNEKINAIRSTEKKIIWDDSDYNYLAIGNSITKHALASYWWNEIGMAASDADHDYYHLVVRYLLEHKKKTHSEAFSFIIWEQQSLDREETLTLLEPYLSDGLDLITIQLGENALSIETFEHDFEVLIRFLQNKAPKARVIIIGDFWTMSNRDALKQNVAKITGAEFVSLEGIKDNPEYYCGIGQIVYDSDGNEHIVEHKGVASHPGDNGMLEIANRIIEQIETGND